MDNPSVNLCPKCKRNDAIRKVSSIVSSQTMRGSFSGPTIDVNGEFGVAFTQGSISNQLVEMLSPPEEPSRGIFESKDSYNEKWRWWNHEMKVWNDLYYCYRDDIVFKYGHTMSSPVAKTYEYLRTMAMTGKHYEDMRINLVNYNQLTNYKYSDLSSNIIELLKARVPHLAYRFEGDEDVINSFAEIPGVTYDAKMKKFYSRNFEISFEGELYNDDPIDEVPIKNSIYQEVSEVSSFYEELYDEFFSMR